MNCKFENVHSAYKTSFKERVFVDCEMANYYVDDTETAVTQKIISVTALNYDGKIIFSKYVKPDAKLKSAESAIHGIRLDEIMTAVPIDKIKGWIEKVFNNTIVVGFATNNDIQVKPKTPNSVKGNR